MPQPDFAYLDNLAVEHALCADASEKETLRSELWAGAADFIKTLQLKCKLMSDEDVNQEVASQLGGMIDDYDYTKGSFLGYIAYSARQSVRNIYRDERPGGFSRRALEGANQIREIQTKERVSLEEAQVSVFNKLGVGLLLQTHIQEALAAQDVATSLSTPLGSDGLTWEDALVSDDAAEGIDRTTLAIDIKAVPHRYTEVLQQILDGVTGLHEINFPKPMSLAEKAVFVDTALRLLRAKMEGVIPAA